MTIYRTWSDMQELLGDLMTREWGDLVASTQPTLGYDDTEQSGGPAPAQIADGVRAGGRRSCATTSCSCGSSSSTPS